MTRYKTKTHGDVEVNITWEKINGFLEPVSFTITSLEGRPIALSRIAMDLIPTLPSIMKQERARLTAGVFKKPTKKKLHKGKKLTDDELTSVADVYRDAYSKGLSVQKAVADAFGLCPSTAGKRIMKARQAGLLEVRAQRATK
jgi:hypothetical protein